jgi:hypothetical protein
LAAPRPIPASGAAAPQPIGAAPRPVVVGKDAIPRPAPPNLVAGPPVVRERHDDESTEDRLKAMTSRYSTPMLISAVVHMLFIIILGLLAAGSGIDRSIVTINATYAEDLGEQLLDPTQTDTVIAPAEDLAAMAESLPVVSDPFAEAPNLTIDSLFGGTAGGGTSANPSLPIALAGREHGMKSMLLGKYGGSMKSEQAVTLGLEWLAKQQLKTGSWSLKGKYSGGATFENNEAATAMALLAFQGAGNTHQTGKYKANVAAGLKALLRSQDRDGNFYRGGQRDESLYTQAQCTIVLCELYAMSKDSGIRNNAISAVQYCIDAQDQELGGWRYTPRNDSDTSVTGWMVMAMQSAKMAGLEVPQEVFDRIGKYLDSASPSGGSTYCYLGTRGQAEANATPAMTAEGLLCRQYLGWKQDDPRLVRGVKLLLHPENEHLPRWTATDRDHYYWYYATQLMHHMEGEYWKTWNDAYRDMIVQHQELKGNERGSWEPLGKEPDLWCQRGQGGRLYVTCLSLYTLEVYYRHMPLYSSLNK